MKINGWDISEANAKQWNVHPAFSSVKNSSEWAKGMLSPIFLRGDIGFKTIKVVLLVRGPDREGVLQNCSMILAKMNGIIHMELDGFLHKFCGVLTKYDFTENPMGRQRVSNNQKSKLTLTISCYEYAENQDGTPFTESFSRETEFVLVNPGTYYTPCVVKLTPSAEIVELNLSGISRDINTDEEMCVTLKNLTPGNTIILDGEYGIFTEEGTDKSADIDIWSLPMLKPGENKITLDSIWLDVNVEYRPRYM